MMQGDSYTISFSIESDGQVIDATKIDDIEFVLATIRKTLKDGAISYRSDDKKYLVNISQQETLPVPVGDQPIYIRVRFVNGDVLGTVAGSVQVAYSRSKKVLI